ncbi:uncharacterized protein LOC143325418 [Chaetodon auriga]|uniref:uncharacterized protein LOC143325418 n=1 Tax=Chaetodon auriga TaxID=39042 RepID=UPI0040328E92
MNSGHVELLTGRSFSPDAGLRFLSRKMMRVLLFLVACFCVGLSYDQEEYGSTLRWRMHRKAHFIEFTHTHSSTPRILWQRDFPLNREGSRHKVIGSNYVLSNLTQEDSGRYIMRDSNRLSLSSKTIEVIENFRSYTRSPGESLTVAFDLEPHFCNIFFYPESSYDEKEIVLQGRLQYLYGQDCTGFVLLKPCGILNEDLKLSCQGRFDVRDSNGNTALKVSLEMEEPAFDGSKIGIGFGVSLLVMSCCTCMRHCCCGKSSSKKETSETPEAEAEPAVHYHEYDREPVGPRPEHLSPPPDTHYPAPSSYTPSDPLIHNPPMDVPPSYFEVSVPVERADAPAVPVPLPSEPDQRFELKGMNFPSVLGAGSAISDVYSSDKMNFL